MASWLDVLGLTAEVEARKKRERRQAAAKRGAAERVYRCRYIVVRRDWSADGYAMEIVSGWASKSAAQDVWAKSLTDSDLAFGKPAGENFDEWDIVDREEAGLSRGLA